MSDLGGDAGGLRRRGAVAALGVAAALVGCSSTDDVSRTGPTLSVAKYDPSAGQYDLCPGNGPLSAFGRQQIGLLFGPDASSCTFVQGTDTALVIADYVTATGDTVPIADCGAIQLPTLTISYPDASYPTKELSRCAPDGSGHQHYVAFGAGPIPLDVASGVFFTVASADGFTTSTDGFATSPGQVGLTLCGGAKCEPVAGIDLVAVHVSIPRAASSSATPTATLTWDTASVPTQSKPITLSAVGEALEGDTTILAPDAPGETLSVHAQIAGLDEGDASALLAAPQDLVVTLSNDARTTPVDGIVAGDPDVGCRSFDVEIEAPTGAPGQQVTLTASDLVFSGGSATTTATLTKGGCGPGGGPACGVGHAHAVIPFLEAQGAVEIAASGGAVVSGFAAVPILSALPAGATLASPVMTVGVGATGSSAVTLQGALIPPLARVQFGPNATVSVVVSAAAASGPTTGPCGAFIGAAAVACPANRGASGGCVLARRTVPVSADGTFSVGLAAGVCFAGKVTVDVWGPTYASGTGCLRDRAAGPAAPLTEGGGVQLTYQVTP